MTRRICPCGRVIYANLGGRCHVCLDERRVRRAAEAAESTKIIRLPSIDKDRCPAHLAWIRTHPCAVFGCNRPAQAAHVRMNTGGGMGIKPADHWTIPLCGGIDGHHGEQHQIGHAAFDAKYGLDSRAMAERLAAKSPFLPVLQANS